MPEIAGQLKVCFTYLLFAESVVAFTLQQLLDYIP